MLKFFKGIFKRKEQPLDSAEIKAEELEQWVEEQLDQEKYKEAALSFFNRIKDKRWLLEEKLELLRIAEVKEKDKSVEDKLKNMVLGHKENYHREMQRFAESLEIPAEQGLSAAIKFSIFLDQQLSDLSKRTARNYQAAQHLFFEPVEEVFKAVAEINSSLREFRSFLADYNLDQLSMFKEKARLLVEHKRRKARIREELDLKEERKRRSLEGKEKQAELVDKLKRGEEYGEFRALKEKEERIRSMIKDAEDEVHLFFSRLQRLLKKYERIAAEPKALSVYIQDPVNNFFHDSGLKISGILEELNRNLDQLGADDKEKIALSDALAKSKGSYLKELQMRREEQAARAEDLRMKLRRYNLDNQIEEAEYKKEHFEEQAILLGREAEELKIRLNSFEEEQLKEELAGLAREMLRTELKLT